MAIHFFPSMKRFLLLCLGLLVLFMGITAVFSVLMFGAASQRVMLEAAEYERQQAQQQAQQQVEQNRQLQLQYAQAIERKSVLIGMSKAQVKAAWAEPTKVNVPSANREQWIYRRERSNDPAFNPDPVTWTLIFDGDVLTNWQRY